MSIGVLAFTFACVCGIVCVAGYNAPEPERPQEARTFDYAALEPKEI